MPYFEDRASCGRPACWQPTNLYGGNHLTRFFGKNLHLRHFLFRKIHFRCVLVRHIQRRKTWKWPPTRKQKGRPLPSMTTSHWLHENSIPKTGCHYFLAGPIAFPKNTLPIWTLGYCRSPKHSRILKNVCCGLWTEAKFGSFLSCGWLPLWLLDKIGKRGHKRSARCGIIMWPCQYGAYQLEPQERIPRLDLFGYQGFFGVGLWLVTPTKVFLLNCLLKIAKKAGVR